MRKMLYVLMGVLLISSGVQAKSFDHGPRNMPHQANQTIIVNNYQNDMHKPHCSDCRREPKFVHHEHGKIHHKSDDTALKVAAVSAGVVGTVALLAALAH